MERADGAQAVGGLGVVAPGSLSEEVSPWQPTARHGAPGNIEADVSENPEHRKTTLFCLETPTGRTAAPPTDLACDGKLQPLCPQMPQRKEGV